MFVRMLEAQMKTFFEKSGLALFTPFYSPSTGGFGVSPHFWTSSFPPMILGKPPGCQMLHEGSDRKAGTQALNSHKH